MKHGNYKLGDFTRIKDKIVICSKRGLMVIVDENRGPNKIMGS